MLAAMRRASCMQAGEEITATIDAAKASGAAALNVLSSGLLYGNRQIIMDRVAALRFPAIYPWAEEAEEGGFLAYGPRILQIFRELIARQLVKLLRGVKPADIPIEQPTKFELVINLKTANAIGVTVPATLVARAVSTGRGNSSLWGVQFSPLGGLAISRFLDQRLRFSAVDHDA